MNVTLSSKGQLAIPKEIREKDDLAQSDVFRLDRIAPGKYVLERLQPSDVPKAKLEIKPDGLPVFRVPKGTPTMTSEMVKKLEAETL